MITARSSGCCSPAASRSILTIESAGTLVWRARPLPSLIVMPGSQMPSLVSSARTTLVASAIDPGLPAPIAAWRKITSAASLSLTMSRCSTIRSRGIEETLATTGADFGACADCVVVTLIPCLDKRCGEGSGGLLGRIFVTRARRAVTHLAFVNPERRGP